MEVLHVVPNMKEIGPAFTDDAQSISSYLEHLQDQQAQSLKERLESSGEATIKILDQEITLRHNMVSIIRQEEKVFGETFIPHVIEPSYGIGRIVYTILEHCYWVRKATDVLSIPPRIAPIKCSVLPLLTKPNVLKFVPIIVANLTAAGVSHKVDSTGHIYKRYARTDEIGIPFGITIDTQTIEDNSITLRERDSTLQIRVPIAKVARLLQNIMLGWTNWQAITESKKYPLQEVKE